MKEVVEKSSMEVFLYKEDSGYFLDEAWWLLLVYCSENSGMHGFIPSLVRELLNKEETKKREQPKKFRKRHGDEHVWFDGVYRVWITTDGIHGTKTDKTDSNTRTDKTDKSNTFRESDVSKNNTFHKREMW